MAVGILSFIGLMVMLVTDAVFDNLSNIQHRKYIVIADIVFSCKITSFLYWINKSEMFVVVRISLFSFVLMSQAYLSPLHST